MRGRSAGSRRLSEGPPTRAAGALRGPRRDRGPGHGKGLMQDSIVYVVETDLDPERLNEVGLEVFRLWTAFALGAQEINGKVIADPDRKSTRLNSSHVR